MEINPDFSDKAKKDYRLVQQAIEGDQSAYAELLGHYYDPIYFMLRKMVNNNIDAEDLTIEAFGKAFKSIKDYTPDYAFSTWLFKIATNNCIDFLRKKRNSQQYISIDSLPGSEKINEMNVTLVAKTPNPEEELIIKQKMKLLRGVVDKLDVRYRKLIELRYFKEFSYAEIAEHLDLPLGSVKAHLYRARELLYTILSNIRTK